MKRIIYLIILTIGGAFQISTAAGENAESVLKHVIDRMNSSPVDARFTIKASGLSQEGSITISGKKFVAITSDLSTWYDGKTQWTFSPAINEVNMTTPTVEELAEINPLIILGSLSSNFNAEMGTTRPGQYEILLVAKNKESGIASARVNVDISTWFPRSIDILSNTGEHFTIDIKSIKNLKTVGENTFRFNSKSYPGVEVIDLR